MKPTANKMTWLACVAYYRIRYPDGSIGAHQFPDRAFAEQVAARVPGHVVAFDRVGKIVWEANESTRKEEQC